MGDNKPLSLNTWLNIRILQELSSRQEDDKLIYPSEAEVLSWYDSYMDGWRATT